MAFKVSDIIIYPIKSLSGISLPKVEVTSIGLENDRKWMLIDENGQFMSQREYPQLATFKTTLSEGHLIVSHQNAQIQFKLDTHTEEVKKVSVWNSQLKTHLVSNEVSEWFSNHLNAKVDLVLMTEISKRYKRLFVPPFKTYVSLADGYPILILGTASMDHLNEKMDDPLNIDRFRANIIVETDTPHEEDDWSTFSIGSADLKVIKPCARCIVTTINQSTAALGKEPLKTLSTYRKKNNKIFFGANVVVLNEGSFGVGDLVSTGNKD